MAAEQQQKMRIPAPDPLGILEALSGGTLYDPFLSAQAAITGGVAPVKPAETQFIPEGSKKTLYDSQVDTYLLHLYDAYRVAPCSGCKQLVESAITGAEVFRYMQDENLTVEQVKQDPDKINLIKEKVKSKLSSI